MNPYGTVLRIQRRAVDAVRLEIRVETDQLDHTTGAQAQLERNLLEERRIALPNWLTSTDAWLVRVRAERARLAAQAQSSQARLAQLRARAAETYGAMHAIQTASERWVEARDADEARAEQAESDDLVGARFARALRKHPRFA